MRAYKDYWLYRSAPGEVADNTIPVIQMPFMSLREARQVATGLGGEIDIYGVPTRGGTQRLVEHGRVEG